MAHHYTKRTVEASAWCPVCYKMAPHAVFDGRIAHCKNDHPHPEPEKPDDRQLEMFK